MSSLALLEPEIPHPLVAVVAFPFSMDVVEVMVVRMVPFLADPGEAKGCSTNTSVIN